MTAILDEAESGARAQSLEGQQFVVLGGGGFLGRAIVAEITRAGGSVRIVDASPRHEVVLDEQIEHVVASILDRDALSAAFADADVVFNLAGKLGTSELDDDIASAVEVNVLGAVRVFDAAVECGVRKVFYPTKPNVWMNAYTITKQASEHLAQLYNASGKMDICSLRYFNAYGPAQHLAPIRKIVPTFAALALRGHPLQIFGDGEQVVDMLYSQDLARLTVAFTSGATPPVPCDCGTGIGMTVNEVAVAVNEVVGSTEGLRHVPMRVGETPGTTLVADIDDMLGVTGPFDFTPWRDALIETIAWYDNLGGSVLDDALERHGLV